ncbi:coiled-coil domain-containing protein [Dactylosporangium sp. CA-139066]|uniref:coiled-coil domain-containing protein n=1 Tax=Dactylosporangium sp. CA-139066 TaxID=3239930 RepID=UPI003D8E2E3D
MSRFSWIAALLCALTILLTPAAAPAAPSSPGSSEGGTVDLEQRLEAANRAYIDAQNKINASRQRQAELAAQQAALEPQYEKLLDETTAVSVAAYQRGGGLRSLSSVLDSPTPGVFADRVSMLELVARREGEHLKRLADVRAELGATKAAVDDEVATQQAQLAVMAKQKADVEAALDAAQNAEAQRGLDVAKTTSAKAPKVVAEPAPRRPDGSWADETCSVPDPTTAGCLTPRTLHALQQVQKAGFKHFVSCWRPPGEPFEHPKGRACDFAADAKGFGGIAEGASLEYGTSLATWLVRNAERLGVMYVIWFRQIWTPAAGWHVYGSGKGDPSSDHTNHVHMSIY